MNRIWREEKTSQRDASPKLNQVPFARKSRIRNRIVPVSEIEEIGVMSRAADEAIVSMATLEHIVTVSAD